MRIDVFVDRLSGGGAERVASNLASAWAEAGHLVRIVTLSGLAEVEYRPASQVSIIALGEPSWFGRLGKLGRLAHKFTMMRRVVASSDAEITLAIGASLAVELSLATWGLRTRIVACEHSIAERSIRSLWRPFRPSVYRRLPAVVALTDRSSEALRRMCRGCKVVTIPNAVRFPIPTVPPYISPTSVARKSRSILLTVGRLSPEKGFDVLVRRFARLAAENEAVDLVILGEGLARAELESLVSEHGLSDRVHLPGRVGNVSDWYDRASVFVMTSRWEGFPMVLLEALAHGVPAVVTDFYDGPREIIQHGVNGFIVPADNEGEWLSTVQVLLNDQVRRAELSAAAKNVRTTFGEETVLARWQALFDQLAAEPEGRRGDSAAKGPGSH
jgi:glycosyltransferase involved in cell wall biosynthesis